MDRFQELNQSVANTDHVSEWRDPMKSSRWVVAVVLCLLAGSVLGSPAVAAGQHSPSADSAQAQVPTCMTRAAYRKIKVDMKFRDVKVIIKKQKPVSYFTMTREPDLMYQGCGWTNGKGVGLQYVRGLGAPLGSATLTRKYLNQCGLAPTCM